MILFIRHGETLWNVEGRIQGTRRNETQASGGRRFDEDSLTGNGIEPSSRVLERIQAALEEICQGPMPVLVVTHRGWIKGLHTLLRTGLETQNADNLASFLFDPGSLAGRQSPLRSFGGYVEGAKT